MLILIIIGLLGLIFGLSLILYFTSKDVIGDSANSTEDYDDFMIEATHWSVPSRPERGE